jgi:phosphatidylglycerol---prolipoprotein diacylglyceryl transferase
MLTFPEINPVAVAIGPLKIRWYALTYLVGFGAAWWLGNWRAAKSGSGWTKQQVADLITNGMLGAILGGRIGYILFYNFGAFIDNPAMIIRVWEGGMSFHGGFIGVAIATALFARSTGKSMLDVFDFVAPLTPIGLGAGRIGNFINGELWGRAADVPWAMIFPGDPARLPRHPSQLYQFALEGVVLFILLWWYSSKPRPRFAVAGLFLVGYGLQRFCVEFFREPDKGLGFVAFDWMSRGQQLSLPMVVAGAIILVMAYRGRFA